MIRLASGLAGFLRWHRVGILSSAALLGIGTALFAPSVAYHVERPGDYRAHIRFAREMFKGARPPLTHPLFHSATIGVKKLARVSWMTAGAVVGLSSHLLTALVVFWLFVCPALKRPLNCGAAVVGVAMTLALLLVSAVTVFDWDSKQVYHGYLVPNVFHSPTLEVLRPFALGMLFYGAGVFSGRPHFGTRLAVGLALASSLLAGLAKPHYTLVILPALALAAAWRVYRRQPVHWPLLLAGIAAPSAILLALQFSGFPDFADRTDQIAFSPFGFFVAHDRDQHLLPKFIASILFPLAVTLGYWKEARRDISFNLSWLALGFGAFLTYFIVESDSPRTGNFTWSGQIALFALFVVAGAFYLRQVHRGGLRLAVTGASIVCALALALHLASGVLWFTVRSFPGHPGWH